MARGHIMMVIRLLAGRTGGAERMFCETASMFADQGYQVTAVHCERSSAPPSFPLSPGVALVNLRAHRPGWYRALDGLAAGYRGGWGRAPVAWLARNLFFVRRLHHIIRERNPDLIVSFLPPANTPSLIAGRWAGTPVIPTNHNVPEQDYRSPRRWDQNPIDRFLRLRALRSAERIHVLFPSFADWFPDQVRDRVVVIPNFVSAEFLTAAAGPPRLPQVLASGRLVDEKNHRALIDAWSLIAARHPDWSVVICGDGPLRAELQQRIDDLGLAASVRLAGRCDDMPAVYRRAELLCHPARFEGFGLAVAEALACGLPVVAFADCAGVNQLVHDGVNGILVERAGGPAALAGALERLVESPSMRAALRERCPDSVQGFSAEAYRSRWLAVVDDVMAGAA